MARSKLKMSGSQNLLVGQTGSGKTTYTLKLLKASKFDQVYIFTTTPWEWRGLSRITVLTYDEIAVVDNLFNAANRQTTKAVVIDNFVGVINLRGTDVVERLFTQGRHYNIATFVLTQHATKMSPTCRENARHIWLFRSSHINYSVTYLSQNKFTREKDWIAFCKKRSGYTPIFINNADLSLEDNVWLDERSPASLRSQSRINNC